MPLPKLTKDTRAVACLLPRLALVVCGAALLLPDGSAGFQRSSAAWAQQPPAGQADAKVEQATAANPHADYQWLSDLAEENARVGWGEFGKGGVLGGVKSPHGLSMHADASVEYVLDKQYRTFRGTAAINDTVQTGPERPLVFQVFGDERLLWESAGLRERFDYQECLLDITGVGRLRLTAIYDPQRTGHGHEGHSFWLEPRVERSAPDAALLQLFNAKAVREAREIEVYKHEIRALFVQADYDNLEKLAEESRKKPQNLQFSPKLGLFYTAIEPPDGYLETQWLAHFERLKNWRSRHPDKITSYGAEAGARINFAFGARGTGLANTVTPEAGKMFASRMAEAETALDAGKKHATPDVYYWHMCMRIARNLGPAAAVKEHFEKTIAIDPKFYWAYTSAADALQPRWQGRPGEVEKFAQDLRVRIGGDEGDVVFGLFACTTASYEGEQIFDHTQFEYPAVKPCLEKLVRRFPQNQFVVHHAALMALAARDRAFAGELFGLIGPVACKPSIWGDSMRFEGARNWSSDKTLPDGRLHVLSMHFDVKSVAFSSDGARIFAAGPVANEVRAWDAKSGELTDTWYLERPLAVAVHPKESRLVVGGGSDLAGTLPVLVSCDFDSTVGPQPIKGHSAPVTAIQFSTDGKLLASGGNDKTVLLWNWSSLANPKTLPHPDVIAGLAFSPDAQSLATLTRAGEARIWNLRKTDPEPTVIGNVANPGNGVAWSHDGKQVIYVGGLEKFLVWNAESAGAEAISTGRPTARCVAISPADDLIAFGRENSHLDVFDYRQRTRLKTFPHWAKLRSVAFSPDGKTVVASCYDGAVHVWNIEGLRSK